MSEFMMESGEGDSFNTTSNNAYINENTSFNSSSISAYSAEEEIIQQRGRKSPKKQSLIEQHQFQQQLPQHINTREIFLMLKQSSMQSPEKTTQNQDHHHHHNLISNSDNSLNGIPSCSASSSSISTIAQQDSCSKSKRNLNKTLLRTPVKRRLKLRRDSSMLIFCPNCGNRLIVGGDIAPFAFMCQSCPYKQPIKDRIVSIKYSKLKEVDDVLNDANTWKNVDQADTKCPKCEHEKAYFMQMQIRSADEPSTTFYRCVSCSHNWKEN